MRLERAQLLISVHSAPGEMGEVPMILVLPQPTLYIPVGGQMIITPRCECVDVRLATVEEAADEPTVRVLLMQLIKELLVACS